MGSELYLMELDMVMMEVYGVENLLFVIEKNLKD